MSPNHRGAVYATIQAGLQRKLTPDEKIRLDRLLDSLDFPGRFR